MFKRKKILFSAILFCGIACFFSACSSMETRPYKQMAYAESAFKAATLSGAETNPLSTSVYQLAKDAIQRARSYYRLKNFKNARVQAIRARRLSEEAELKATRSTDGNSNNTNLLPQ